MIIKSMSRKSASFEQLIEYMLDMEKTDQQYNVHQNIYSRKSSEMVEEFLKNALKMRKRKNGNQLYHEILSITKSKNLDEKQQKQILRNIAYDYIKQRAKKNLVFGTLHDDHEGHLHYHLLISANELGESNKTRLTKAQFATIKKDLEAQVLQKYPELEQKEVMNKQANEKLSKKGAEQKRRTGKTPQRDELKAKLADIFSQCESKAEFFERLQAAKLELYIRGKTVGIKDLATNRNHRLKTLGLLDEFEACSKRIEQDESVNKQQSEKPKASPKTGDSNSFQQEDTPKQEPKESSKQKRQREIDELRKQQSKYSSSQKKQ